MKPSRHDLAKLIIAAERASHLLRRRVYHARLLGRITETVAVDEVEAVAATLDQLIEVALEQHAQACARDRLRAAAEVSP